MFKGQPHIRHVLLTGGLSHPLTWPAINLHKNPFYALNMALTDNYAAYKSMNDGALILVRTRLEVERLVEGFSLNEIHRFNRHYVKYSLHQRGKWLRVTPGTSPS